MDTDLILIKKVSEVNSCFAVLAISFLFAKTYVEKQTLVVKFTKQNNCIQLLITTIQKSEPMKNTVIEGHINKIDEYVYKTLLKDEMDLVQLFERLETYSNLKTISNYAKENKMSYNGVKKHRNIITLFGVKFVDED